MVDFFESVYCIQITYNVGRTLLPQNSGIEIRLSDFISSFQVNLKITIIY